MRPCFTGALFVFMLVVCTAVLPASRRAVASSAVLVGQLGVSPMVNYADVWGWTDPVTGRHYALVGNNASGLHIVDVTNPALPLAVATVTAVPRFDMKTFGSLVYSVDGLQGTGKVLDISIPASPVVVGSFPGGHNVFIDDAGFLYVCLPGLKIYDLNTTPETPVLVWEDGLSAPEDGHDATVIGNTLYEFRGVPGVRIWDVTDRHAPVPMGAITDPTIAYAHSGWPTEDGRYLFVTDEFARDPAPDIIVWDIANPETPRRVGAIFDPDATAHNCYVIGDVLYVAYYLAGFRIYDVGDPRNPVLLDTYDTTPTMTGEGIFQGAWGCYPFSPDGHVYVSDRPSGLFVFRIDGLATGVERGARAPSLEVSAGAPNPFGTETVVRYSLATGSAVSAEVFDAAGRRVRALYAGFRAAGEHRATWDGRSDAGLSMPSGVYFCRVRTPGSERTIRMVLLR